MHKVLVIVGVAAIVAISVGLALGNGSMTTSPLAPQRPCGDRIFGHVASLERRGSEYRMRFDPAWFTTGVTASTAAAEDGAVEPGQPVPNDVYVVDESHRLLTYPVSPSAHVTVLGLKRPGEWGETPIDVAELERIVNGGAHRPLFEPLDSGVWIRVHIDTVCSVEQQYRP